MAAAAFTGLMLLPVDFPYWLFALIIFCNGVGSGLFASPNTSAIMSSVPARHRGAASGMRSTFQNSGMSLSIGIFFSLMIAGLAATLPRTLSSGLRAQGVPAAVASHVAHLPPVSTLFSALLGYNPIRSLLGPSGVLNRLPARNAAVLTGKQFFPNLIAGPFHHGLIIVFTAAIAMSLAGALISLLRGRQFYYDDRPRCRPSPPRRGAGAAAADGSRPASVTAAATGTGRLRPDPAGNGHQPSRSPDPAARSGPSRPARPGPGSATDRRDTAGRGLARLRTGPGATPPPRPPGSSPAASGPPCSTAWVTQ